MTPDSIVSLAPSTTATIDALGCADRLVGVTAHCSVDAPVVGGWLNPEYDRIEALNPDYICTSDSLQQEIRDEFCDQGYTVIHTEPARLEDVLESFATVGETIGEPEAGRQLERSARERLAVIDSETDDTDRPVVYCEEWSDPPMAAGNWVPDAVVAAGGTYPFVDPGDRSTEVTQTEVESAAPEHAVLHICGFGERVTADRITDRPWNIDPTVHIFDDSLLNQPSPRLIDGIETLATILRSA